MGIPKLVTGQVQRSQAKAQKSVLRKDVQEQFFKTMLRKAEELEKQGDEQGAANLRAAVREQRRIYDANLSGSSSGASATSQELVRCN